MYSSPHLHNFMRLQLGKLMDHARRAPALSPLHRAEATLSIHPQQGKGHFLSLCQQHHET